MTTLHPRSHPSSRVNFLILDPSAFITKTSFMCSESPGEGPVRELSNAIFLPSGDHTGQPLSARPLVSLFAPLRRALATQTCQCPARSLLM